jgi:hypothetical protein
MNGCVEPLRLLYARWCLLAAAEPVLAAAGVPLPFRITVDGPHGGLADATGGWVARYDASASAGATLARFPGHRAVLSCGDAGWRLPGGPTAAKLLATGPAWADHATMIDHRVRGGHFGWAAFWENGSWNCEQSPELPLPLPSVQSTESTAAALAGRFDDRPRSIDAMFHLVRMCEYEWLDTASWETALGHLVPRRVAEESWSNLVRWGLTQWSGSGPLTEGVPGPTPDQAVASAAEHARSEGPRIPEDVRVDSALRTRKGWQVRFLDYRDAHHARPVVVMVPDEGPIKSLGTTPG